MPYRVTEINPSRTAFVIVDMENDFVAEGAPLRAKMAPEVVPPLKRALAHARNAGMRVIFTTHAHRRDGSDMGVFGTSMPPIAQRMALVDGETGVEIYDELKPLSDEIVIKKHRYSARSTGPISTSCCAAVAWRL
jgi:nicotinamidase-related amidase